MVLPLVLIVVAVLAAGVVAYGTHPGWADFQHGLQLIIWSRRLQWPLVTLSLLTCLAVVVLVIAARRRAWWLIGLGPVLALFLHHFHTERAQGFSVVENPATVSAAAATALGDDDYVVGVALGDASYAYPYAALFRTPVVIQTEHDQRMIVLWSAYANRVLAFRVENELKGRDLEVVSMPANAPLLFNSRLGQFINALKGQTPDGQKPAGFGSPLPTVKTTWGKWRADHPAGKLMWPGPPPAGAPTRPILPAYAMRSTTQPASPVRVRVTVIGTTRPAAVEAESLGPAPLNTHADGNPVFVFRPSPAAPARAFDRRFGDDIRSRFDPKRDAKHPDIAFKDVDTGTSWNNAGVAVAGSKPFVGKRLNAVPADDDVDWAVMKYWYPDLELDKTPPAVQLPPPTGQGPTPTTKPAKKRPKSRPTTPKPPAKN